MLSYFHNFKKQKLTTTTKKATFHIWLVLPCPLQFLSPPTLAPYSRLLSSLSIPQSYFPFGSFASYSWLWIYLILSALPRLSSSNWNVGSLRARVPHFCFPPAPEHCLEHSTAAAKSLQSCPTLCEPVDGSPPGSPVPGILQARTPEWVAISFSNA